MLLSRRVSFTRTGVHFARKRSSAQRRIRFCMLVFRKPLVHNTRSERVFTHPITVQRANKDAIIKIVLFHAGATKGGLVSDSSIET